MLLFDKFCGQLIAFTSGPMQSEAIRHCYILLPTVSYPGTHIVIFYVNIILCRPISLFCISASLNYSSYHYWYCSAVYRMACITDAASHSSAQKILLILGAHYQIEVTDSSTTTVAGNGHAANFFYSTCARQPRLRSHVELHVRT